MKGRIVKWRTVLALSCVLGMPSVSVVAGDSSVVIANKSVDEADIDRDAIRLVFLRKRMSWGGTRATLCYVRKGDALKDFSQRVLGKSSRQLVSYWKKLMFTGKSRMPRTFDTEQELLEYVQTHEGAIGVVSADLVLKNVRVVDSAPLARNDPAR